MEILIILVLWGLCGWGAMAICSTKGRDPGLGLALGLLLGIIGVLIAAVLAPGNRARTVRTYHPSTGEVTFEPVYPHGTCPSCGKARTSIHIPICWNCGAVFAELAATASRLCPFCRGDIPTDAQKCRHCREWVVPESERSAIS